MFLQLVRNRRTINFYNDDASTMAAVIYQPNGKPRPALHLFLST